MTPQEEIDSQYASSSDPTYFPYATNLENQTPKRSVANLVTYLFVVIGLALIVIGMTMKVEVITGVGGILAICGFGSLVHKVFESAASE